MNRQQQSDPHSHRRLGKEQQLKEGAGLIKAGMCCVLAVWIAGCATHKENGSAKQTGSSERHLNSLWAGKPYKDLVAEYGKPTSVMDHPNSRNSSVVVYRDNEKLTSSCSHAFTIQHGEVPVVVNYFCR